MGLSLMSNSELAALGWYPVRYEPLESGASGYGEMILVDGEYVIPSLPADYESALSQWRATAHVERLQARLALIQNNFWESVVVYFSDPSRTTVERAFWEDARTWRRDDPTVMAAGAALGLTEAQVDDLFKLAATL